MSKWKTYKKWLVTYLTDKEPENTYGPKVGEIWFLKLHANGDILKILIKGISNNIISIKTITFGKDPTYPSVYDGHYQLKDLILLGKADD